jgi:ABC-type uncharacterized transport system permease subunit
VFHQVWLVYLGLATLLATSLVMRRTALGAALHAVGAAPRLVDQSGLSVTRLRYGAVLFSGVMSGVAGCFISAGDGSLRKGMDPLHLYVALVSLCSFHKSNAFTLSRIFNTDMLATQWQEDHKAQAHEMVRAFVAAGAT